MLGQFRLDEFVGGGGMGAVFRGIDTTLDRIVAVKVVSTDHTDEDTLRRFRNEAQSAARLDHPNIARVYSVGEERGWNYIVFEFIEGVNVRDLVVHKGPLPLEEAISYVIQAADALEHASQRDVVHRDIKPSNLLVMEDGRAKIVDMGLARLHDVESSSEDITATGVTLGTFDYISPEQARDPRDTDVRSDLYSLGCSFYYMLTGMPPFPEGTVLQKLLSHSSEAPPDPRDLRGDLPEAVSTIVLKLMAKQPAQRYQRPAELVAALVAASQSLGLATPVSHRVALPQRTLWAGSLSNHIPWLVPVGLLFVIVLGLEAILPSPDSKVTSQNTLPRIEPREAIRAPGSPNQITPTPAETNTTVAPAATSVAAASNPTVSLTPANSASTTVANSDNTQTASNAAPTATESVNASQSPLEETDIAIEVPPTAASIEVMPEVLLAAAAQVPDIGKSGDALSNPADVPVSPATVASNRLIVMPEGPPTTDTNVVRSLEEGLRRLSEAPEINTLELRFNRYVSQPLTLDLRSDLMIEAGTGYSPLLVFQRTEADIYGDRRMLQVLGGKLSIQGVHFRVELPYAPAEGWSLFYLNQAKELSLVRCTLTIRNDYRSEAAFFHVQGPQSSSMMMPDDDMPVVSRPSITLESCIARGQATFVRETDGLPCKLNWKQGFLATSERLIELGQQSEAAPVEVARVKLERVTAVVERGLCRVTIRDPAARVPQLDIQNDNCLIDHHPEAPLIEHLGVANADATLANALRQSGRSNAYPRIDICWRIQSRESDPRVIHWGEQSDYAWYSEGSSEPYTPWLNGPPNSRQAVYDALPQDYLVEDNDLGFDPALLPELSDVQSTIAESNLTTGSQ